MTPHELIELAGAAPALVAAPDGTTNALALADARDFRPLYGRGSAHRFGLRRLELRGLSEDVDTRGGSRAAGRPRRAEHAQGNAGQRVNVVALSGGFGGAKFVRALVETLGGEHVTAVVNVGDDLEFLGLRVSPDLDGVLYALAGVADEERGWGRAGETWNALDTVSRLGDPDWFKLGDRDLGLHVVRTNALRSGEPLSAFTRRARALSGSPRRSCRRPTTSCGRS